MSPLEHLAETVEELRLAVRARSVLADALASERDALRAEVGRLRTALRLALLWLPDPAMHESMSPGARDQLERIRGALKEGP